MPLVSDPSFGTGTQLVIDPSEVAVDRTEFPINEGDVKVAEGGPDWGQAAITAATAEAARGELPVDFRIPNRQITIPLLLGGTPGGADFDTQRRYLQAKVGLIQREGGWLKRQDPGKDPIYFDLVNASLTLPDQYGHLNVESGVVLTLEAIPDFYGDEDELTLSASSETTLPELTFTTTDVEGDYPGRLRLEVTNDSAADQLGLVACVRSRHYDPAATARLAYEAEALTPLDTATTAALSGASGSGSNTVKHDNLSTSWTPVLSTNLLAGTFLTHRGSYRVRARVYTTSAKPPSLRFVWDVGDLVFPEENDPWLIPGAAQFYLADLGEIRLDAVSAGAHRWLGHIQAKGSAGGENVSIDRIWLEPLDEGHAVLRAPITLGGGFFAFQGQDSFNQTSGALNGKASVGDDWSTAGDATDFQVSSGSHAVTRNAIGDTAGRFAFLGASSVEAAVVSIDFEREPEPDGTTVTQGVLARYTDSTHYLLAEFTADSGRNYLSLDLHDGGTFVSLAKVALNAAGAAAGPTFPLHDFEVAASSIYTIQLYVDEAGRAFVWLAAAGSRLGEPIIRIQDSRLATGGTLASGSIGFYDLGAVGGGGSPFIRTYDNWTVYVPTPDAVAYAGQSVQLATDGNVREDSTGTAYGPVSIDSGDLLRIPPSGIEGRTVEFMVKPSRGDFEALPDAGIDDISVRAYARPSFLTLPW